MSAVSFGSFSSFLSHEYKPVSQYYTWQIIVFLFLWGSLFVCFFVCYKLQVCGSLVRADLLAPFLQKRLLTPCLCVTFKKNSHLIVTILQTFIIVFVMVTCKQGLRLAESSEVE